MHRVGFRSSIRRVGQVANKQKELCSSFSSTTGTSNYGNNGKFESIKDNHIRSTPFTSAAVTGKSPSWSDIPVGRSTFISSKASRTKPKPNSSNFLRKNPYSNNAGSNCNTDDDQEFRSVYVHPLSQIVLQYLQETHHEWVVAKGLDQSLTLHRDGSFELKKVPLTHSSMSRASPSSPPSSSKNNIGPLTSTSTSPTGFASTADSNESMRIWTSYDEQEKKHWLTVRRGFFRQRFLLQDNLLTAWNKGVSVPERLQVAVDEMIRAIDRLDQSEQQQAATIGQQWQQRGQRRFRKR